MRRPRLYYGVCIPLLFKGSRERAVIGQCRIFRRVREAGREGWRRRKNETDFVLAKIRRIFVGDPANRRSLPDEGPGNRYCAEESSIGAMENSGVSAKMVSDSKYGFIADCRPCPSWLDVRIYV